MIQTRKYVLLGVGHGINDCIAGYIIGCLFYQGFSLLELGMYTLLYNLLAFGGQLIFARVIALYFIPKKYLLGSFLLLIASLALFNLSAQLAILCAGIASAIIHVTGGLESTREDDKSFGIGIFASPGVIGLIGGGLLAYLNFNFIPVGLLACVAYIAALWLWYIPSSAYQRTCKQEQAIEGHDVIMVVLITIISLRSFIWDVIQMVEQKNYDWLIIIAIAAMCGKITGGIIADKIGHRKYSLYALLLSIPFLTILRKNIITLSIGVFLLQSTIPATTIMVLQLLRKKPALAISLSFGLSVLIAITLFYTPVIKYLNNNISTLLILLASVFLLMWYQRLTRKRVTLQ